MFGQSTPVFGGVMPCLGGVNRLVNVVPVWEIKCFFFSL